MVQLLKLRNTGASLLTKLQTPLGFHQIFYKCPFSVPGSHPRQHSAFSHPVSFDSSGLCWLLGLVSVFHDLHTSEERWEAVYSRPPNLGLSDVFA